VRSRKPSPAAVIAFVALFFAVGGAVALAEAKSGAKAITARLRSSAAVDVPSSGAAAPVPLINSTWTQRAEELDGIGGSITVTAPTAECSSELVVLIESAGREVAAGYAISLEHGAEGVEPGETRTLPLKTFTGPWPFPEPGAVSTDSVTAKVSGTCAGGSWTLDSLRISVVGVK
jgi:hypothetical protein